MMQLLKLQKVKDLLVFSWLEFGWNGEEKREFEDDRKLEREWRRMRESVFLEMSGILACIWLRERRRGMAGLGPSQCHKI